jgi:hypothetical protein
LLWCHNNCCKLFSECEPAEKEIAVEFAAMDVEFHPLLNLRGGMIMNPIGAFNQNHDGPKWEFIDRPISATQMLPATFSNVGFGVFGKKFSKDWVFAYEAYLTNGFDDQIINNTENKTFSMYYALDMGTNHNKKIEIAIEYLRYLGTKDLTAAQLQEEFYKLGCSFDVNVSDEQIWVSLSGLTENIEKATQLFENLLANAQPNEEALANVISDILKKREDAKLNKREILFGALQNYGKYGKKSPYTNILSAEELKNLKEEFEKQLNK